MTKRQGKSGTIDVKALLSEDEEFLRALVRTALQEVLEAEMTEALGAPRGANGRRAGRATGLLRPDIDPLQAETPAGRADVSKCEIGAAAGDLAIMFSGRRPALRHDGAPRGPAWRSFEWSARKLPSFPKNF